VPPPFHRFIRFVQPEPRWAVRVSQVTPSGERAKSPLLSQDYVCLHSGTRFRGNYCDRGIDHHDHDRLPSCSTSANDVFEVRGFERCQAHFSFSDRA
jgi:hypothetical protein